MAGISSKAAGSIENKYKYNGGNELQHEEFSDGSGLELYDAHHRMFDPQLGRFHQIDPLDGLSMTGSLYTFAHDNPVAFNDPLGLADTIRTNTPDKTPGFGPKKQLDEVRVSNSRADSHGGSSGYFGFYYPAVHKNQEKWSNEMFARNRDGQPLSQPGDPSWLKAQQKFHQRNYQAYKEWKTNSLGVVLLIGSPVLITTCPILVFGTETSLVARTSIMLTDAGIQYLEKGEINPIQVLGSNLGPLSYALSSATTYDWNKPFSIGIDENASAGSIAVLTMFNMVGMQWSGIMDESKLAAGAGPVTVIPTVAGDVVNNALSGTLDTYMQHK